MARVSMRNLESPYYPTRARWYTPLLRPWLKPGGGLSAGQIVLGVVVPAFAFFACGRQTLGRAFAAAYVLGWLVFIAFLGLGIGSVGYGIVISVHATSIIFLETLWLRNRIQFVLRMVVNVTTLFVVWFFFYAPIVDYVSQNWFIPCRVNGNIIVYRRSKDFQSVKTGDSIMYHLSAVSLGDPHAGGGAVRIEAGPSWGEVLAKSGDTVEFTPDSVLVNGASRRALRRMPQSGSVVVPDKCWFIWPDFATYGHGHASAEAITEASLRAAIVPQTSLMGKSFKHWLFRRQILP